MHPNESLTEVASRMQDLCSEVDQRSDRRLYLKTNPASIRPVTRLLFDECDARLQTVSGVDGPETIELLYHWANDRHGWVATVQTEINRDSPSIESITENCQAAQWIERELWELLGIQFEGHPDLRHLLLTDDWPKGEFPLRRDYRKE